MSGNVWVALILAIAFVLVTLIMCLFGSGAWKVIFRVKD